VREQEIEGAGGDRQRSNYLRTVAGRRAKLRRKRLGKQGRREVAIFVEEEERGDFLN